MARDINPTRPNLTRPDSSPPTMGDGERLAIWSLRRIAEGPRLCLASDGDGSGHGDSDGGRGPVSRGPGLDLQEVIPAVRAALAEVRRQNGGRLELGCSRSLALTRLERRLLHALAAAQSGDDERLDNYLYKIALHRPVRKRLAAAVTALAAAGYWLADPLPAWRVPAAALPVAEFHGRTVRAGEVAWP